MLDAAGPESARIARLWWLMLSVAAAVYVVVIAWAVLAFRRGRRQRAADAGGSRERPSIEASSDRTMHTVVAAATACTVFILLVLLVASVWTNRAVASLGASSARDDQRHRPSVVVGGRVPRAARRQSVQDRQRDAHPGGPARRHRR